MTVPQPYRPALLAAMLALALYAITLKGTYIEDDIMIVRGRSAAARAGPMEKAAQRAVLARWERRQSVSAPGFTELRVAVAPDRGQIACAGNAAGGSGGGTRWAGARISVSRRQLDFERGGCGDGGGIGAAGVTAPAAGLAPAYLAGLLFAVHPIHVEAVAGLVGRAEMMCTIGILGTLILLLHRPITTGRAIAALCCLAFAIFSKEQGMLIPALMLLLPLCLGVDRPRSERERRAVMLLVLMVCWFTAAYIVLREMKFKFEWDTYFLDFTDQPMVRSHGIDRLLMPLVLLGRYAQLLIFPVHLSPRLRRERDRVDGSFQ